jgi:hypothetical protein
LTLITCAGGALAACGDDSGGPDAGGGPDANVADAGPDAAAPDAAPSPYGVWRVKTLTLPTGGTPTVINDTDTTTPDGVQRVNGLLRINKDTGEGAITAGIVKDGRLNQANGYAANMSFSADYTIFHSGQGADVAAIWDTTGPSEKLRIGDPTQQPTVDFERFTPLNLDTITIDGQISLENQMPVPLAQPRVALLPLVRGTGGALDFFWLSDFDQALPVDFGATGAETFDYTFTKPSGPLGVERIEYGAQPSPGANLAFSAVVVYEDRDDDGQLGRLVVDDCLDPGTDCVRGISPVLLQFKLGDDAELEASPYDQLADFWAQAAFVQDLRGSGGTTIIPFDPTVSKMPADVVVVTDPTTAQLPAITF